MKTKYFIPFLLTLLVACGGGGGGGDSASGGAAASGGSTADTAVPTISTFSPANDASDVAVDASIQITFSEAMTASTVSTTNLTIAPTSSSDGTTDVCTAWTLNAANTVATCTHGDLAPEVDYTITATTGLTDSAGNALAETTSEFTTTDTAGANNPNPTIVIPSFDGTTGGDTITIAFDQAVDSATVTTSSVQVEVDGTETNLCDSLSVSADGLEVTCTLTGVLTCLDTLTKYNVTVNADVQSESGNHAVVPLADYFSNMDDGFANASTIDPGECWSITDGIDSGSGSVAGETIDVDTTNAGRLTISGEEGVDLTDPGDSGPRVEKGSVSLGSAFGVTIRVDSLTSVSDLAEEGFLFLADDLASIDGFFTGFRTDAYRAAAIVSGSEESGTDFSDVCAGCLDTTPVYFCMVVNGDGTITAHFDEDGSGTFTELDTASLSGFPTLADPVAFYFNMPYAADNLTMVVDWIRFNIGEAECPAVTTVE